MSSEPHQSLLLIFLERRQLSVQLDMAAKLLSQVKPRSSSRSPEKPFGIQTLAEEAVYVSVRRNLHSTVILAKWAEKAEKRW